MTKQVEVVRTPITMADYLQAIEAAWPLVDSGPCTAGARAVLYAQYMIETGGRSCFNFNVGNVKAFTGDGFDYHCLRGVWEGVTPAEADRLVAAGQATRDSSGDHAAAVGPGRVSVVFQPPHPQTRFRAFPSLDVAMVEHLKLLHKRFSRAWPPMIAGDYRAFAIALKSHGYFTASADAYAAGMRRFYDHAMASLAADGPAFDLTTATGLQSALSRLGYDVGPIDGFIGRRTINAIRAFQADRGLVVDGVVGPITRSTLAFALTTSA